LERIRSILLVIRKNNEQSDEEKQYHLNKAEMWFLITTEIKEHVTWATELYSKKYSKYCRK
jgi:hypothetical protein